MVTKYILSEGAELRTTHHGKPNAMVSSFPSKRQGTISFVYLKFNGVNLITICSK